MIVLHLMLLVRESEHGIYIKTLHYNMCSAIGESKAQMNTLRQNKLKIN